jgi:hypothetical protein
MDHSTKISNFKVAKKFSSAGKGILRRESGMLAFSRGHAKRRNRQDVKSQIGRKIFIRVEAVHHGAVKKKSPGNRRTDAKSRDRPRID